MRHYRKVIKITGHDSPNVRYGKTQVDKGKEPTDEMLIPGVLPYGEYCKRMELWDPIRKCIGIDAEFYEGGEVLLFPPLWLNAAAQRRVTTSNVRALGVDSAAGGDNAAWAVVCESGLMELVSMKTPDTSVIPDITIGLMNKYNVPDKRVCFDYGGGGKQHVDTLRRRGYNVKAILFGSPATGEKKRGLKLLEVRKHEDEIRMVYKNRRAELYGGVRERLDPAFSEQPFAIPAEILDKPRQDGGPSLRGQLSPIPLWYDEEGRMYLPPKQKRPDVEKNTSKKTLIEIIGCSPDEAEALALGVFGLQAQRVGARAGVAF